MNGCGAIKESLCEWLDEELNAEQRLAVDAHLRQCADCRAELEALRAASNAVHALPVKKAPASILKSLRAEIEAESSAGRHEASVVRAGEAFARPNPEQYWTRGLVSLAAFLAVGVLVYVAVTPHVPEGNFVSEQGSPDAPKARSPEAQAETLKRIEPKDGRDRSAHPFSEGGISAETPAERGRDQENRVGDDGKKDRALEKGKADSNWIGQPGARELQDAAKHDGDTAKRMPALRKDIESDKHAEKQEALETEEVYQKSAENRKRADAKANVPGEAPESAAPSAPPAAPNMPRAKGEPLKEEVRRGNLAAQSDAKDAVAAQPENGKISAPPKPAAAAPMPKSEGLRDETAAEKKGPAAEAKEKAASFKETDTALQKQNQDKAGALAQAHRGEERDAGETEAAPETKKKPSGTAGELGEQSAQGQGGGAAQGPRFGSGRVRTAEDKTKKDANAADPARQEPVLQESLKKEAGGRAQVVALRLKASQVSEFARSLEQKARACGGGLDGAEELAKYRKTTEKQKMPVASKDERNAGKPQEQQAGQLAAEPGHRMILRVPAHKKDEVLALVNAYRLGIANKGAEGSGKKADMEAEVSKASAGKPEEKSIANEPPAKSQRPLATLGEDAVPEPAERKTTGEKSEEERAVLAGAAPGDSAAKNDDALGGLETIEIEIEIIP